MRDRTDDLPPVPRAGAQHAAHGSDVSNVLLIEIAEDGATLVGRDQEREKKAREARHPRTHDFPFRSRRPAHIRVCIAAASSSAPTPARVMAKNFRARPSRSTLPRGLTISVNPLS